MGNGSRLKQNEMDSLKNALVEIAKVEILKHFRVENEADFDFGDAVFVIYGLDKDGNRTDKKTAPVLYIHFPDNIDSDNGINPTSFEVSHSLTLGVLTKSNYISTKKLDVSFNRNIDCDTELSDEEIEMVSKFIVTDFKVNTFDPFYHENEAKRRNASAWNYIVKNYISDPYCTR